MMIILVIFCCNVHKGVLICQSYVAYEGLAPSTPQNMHIDVQEGVRLCWPFITLPVPLTSYLSRSCHLSLTSKKPHRKLQPTANIELLAIVWADIICGSAKIVLVNDAKSGSAPPATTGLEPRYLVQIPLPSLHVKSLALERECRGVKSG